MGIASLPLQGLTIIIRGCRKVSDPRYLQGLEGCQGLTALDRPVLKNLQLQTSWLVEDRATSGCERHCYTIICPKW